MSTEAEKKFNDDTVRFKYNLRAYRLEQGYSIDKFAEAIGVQRKHYETIETLRPYGIYIDWGVACRCADVLGVTLDQLRG